MRNADRIYLELEQMLNLLFSTKSEQSEQNVWLWKKAPFSNALENFCRDAKAFVPTKDLRAHVTKQWLPKKQQNLTSRAAQESLAELLDTNLPSRN